MQSKYIEMDNQKWEEFIKELRASTNSSYNNDNCWSKKIEENSVLRNKLLQILTSDDDSVNRLNKRQINLVRKLLWELDLWRLQLPETFETLQFVLFFKRMQICESCQMLNPDQIPSERTENKCHYLMVQPSTKEEPIIGFLYPMLPIIIVIVVAIVLATY